MSGHTPGPWCVDIPNNRHGHSGIHGGDYVIADLQNDCPLNQTANALLIAAAPDLLEAARAVVARWDSPNWKDQPHTVEFIAKLRVAIAKATGASDA